MNYMTNPPSTQSSTDILATPVVQRYLSALRRALRHGGRAVRDEYVAQIVEHVRDQAALLDASDETQLRKVLLQLGSPSDLANEVLATEWQSLTPEQRFARRCRRWALPFVVTLVMLGGVGAVLWTSHYQPVLVDATSGSFGTSVVALRGQAVVVHNGASPTQTTTYSVGAGRYRVAVTFTVSDVNGLPVTVTPTSSSFPGGINPAIDPFRGSYRWQVENGMTLGRRSFQSLRLNGHSWLQLVMTQTFTCTRSSARPWPGGGTYYELQSLPLNVTFHGFEHYVRVPIAPFWIETRANCSG